MKVGLAVYCDKCGHQKKPHGRSAPMALVFCDDECFGYLLEPQVGCLWPGETAEGFGFPCCDSATEEQA